MHVFIGYDPREHEAAMVCWHSITRHSEQAGVTLLDDRKLRRQGLYNRPYRVTGSGQYVDFRDKRPFSTMFAFTRFLVPALAIKEGLQGWALFCDCDFLFTRSVDELFLLASENKDKAAMCVKHRHIPPDGMKMDGVQQGPYFRKNWSSLTMWNLDDPRNAVLLANSPNMKAGSEAVPFAANYWLGRDLHAFSWLNEEDIGEIPEEWNWLVGVSPTTEAWLHAPHIAPPAGIHFTEGGPWMEGHEDVPFAGKWTDELHRMMGG